MIKELQCPKGKKVISVCISKGCKNNAFICMDDHINRCEDIHKNCSRDITLRKLIMTLEDKPVMNNSQEKLSEISRVFQKVIDDIKRAYDQFKNIANSPGKNNNFFQQISNGQYKSMNGEEMYRIYESINGAEQANQDRIMLRNIDSDKIKINAATKELEKLLAGLYIKSKQPAQRQQKRDQQNPMIKTSSKNELINEPVMQYAKQREGIKITRIPQQQTQSKVQPNNGYTRRERKQQDLADKYARRRRQPEQKSEMQEENTRVYGNRQKIQQRDNREPREHRENREPREHRPQREERRPRRQPQNFQKLSIKDITPNSSNFALLVKVVKMQRGYKNNSGLILVNCVLGDETGIVDGRLLSQPNLKQGAVLYIQNAYVKIWKEHIQINTGQKGRLTDVEQTITVNMSNNISKACFVEA